MAVHLVGREHFHRLLQVGQGGHTMEARLGVLLVNGQVVGVLAGS